MIPRGKDEGINLVSWNVCGLGHSIKRDKVFAHLNSLSADVAFLQETLIRPSEQKRLRCSWADQIFNPHSQAKLAALQSSFVKPYLLSTSQRYVTRISL